MLKISGPYRDYALVLKAKHLAYQQLSHQFEQGFPLESGKNGVRLPKGYPLVWITPHKVFKIGSYLYFNCTSINQRDNLYLIIDILSYFFSLTNGIWLLFT